MIKKPTVLVLGAGASKPYGFPVGQELVNNIVRNARIPGSTLSTILRHCSFDQDYIRSLSDELQGSARASIDAFLESRTDFLEIGRLAIAIELIGFERKEKIYKTGDWYQYLFNKMCDPNQFESFGASKLSIVTFNYDRSLEFCLYTALCKSFQKVSSECVKNFQHISIIHVHGLIGNLPPNDGGWPYGTRISPQTFVNFVNRLDALTKEIKIIHEADADTKEFLQARALLNEAETICFLGFGFHPTNLKRLLTGVDGLCTKDIWCCGYHITDAERKSVEKYFPAFKGPTVSLPVPLRWGKWDHGCLEFLRHSCALEE